jgi:hypothetical protein
MICAASLLVCVLGANGSEGAPHPADAFGGQVLTAEKPFPTSAASKAKYIAQLKKIRTKRIAENKVNKQWKIFYAAFFRRPLNDLEVTVRLWDVTEGKRMLSSFEQYLSRKGERSFHSSVIIEQAQIEPNRRVYMEIVNKGRVLATGEFHLLGEVERPSGQVDFTND